MPTAAPPTPAATLAEFPPEADALIDRLEVGCELRLDRPCRAQERDAMKSSLVSAGLIRSGGDVAFTWCCPHSGAHLALGGRLMFATSGDRHLSTSASVLRMNPLSCLRKQVEGTCGLGLDGNDNVVGPPDEDRPHMLGLQLVTVASILDAFVAACARATGRELAPRFFLRAVEVNRDIVCAAAPAVARRIAGAPGHWFRRVGSVQHPPARGAELDGNLAVAVWRGDRSDAPIRYKFYAKTPGLLRVEVAMDKRKSVNLFGWGDGSAGGAANGLDVAARLRRVAEAGAPVLADMEAHVARFGQAEAGALDLLAALGPLLVLAAPPPAIKAGGRPAVATRNHARQALEMLLTTGRFDASGVPTNSQVRKRLREMAGYGALLHDPRGRATIYALAPSLEPGRRPIASALVPYSPRALQHGQLRRRR